MRSLNKQHGASLLSWVAIIAMVVVIGTAALKLAPIYMEYWNIISILDNMQKEKSLQGASKQDLATTFAKRLDINGIRDLKRGDYKITKVQGKRAYNFRVNYEARRSLMGNLSIVASFDRTFEVGG